jgi:chaperonin GroEL
MTRRILKIGPEARALLIKGATILADAVKVTLGPFPLTAAIEKNDEVIDDGATIAREIAAGCIEDEIQARGARMLEKVSGKTDEIAGDGTTTSIILAESIIRQASLYLSTPDSVGAKMKPADMIRKIDKECKEVVVSLKEMSTHIKTEKQLIECTTVSASDNELGKLIGSAQWELGKDGRMLAEEVNDKVCSIERMKGVEWDSGFSTYVIINNFEKQALEANDVRVLLTNYVLHDLEALNPVLKKLYESGCRSVVLLARAFGKNAILRCQNESNAGFNVFPVNGPYTNQNEIMQDLAAITGGRYVYTEDSRIENVQVSDFGFAEKIFSRASNSIITGKNDTATQERVNRRIEELKRKLVGAMSEFEKSGIELRISQLTNGVAKVKIGAETDLKRKYIKRKADDAVSSARASLQEGVVAGAGLAFKKISEGLPDSYILKIPLLSIHEQILSSAPDGFKVEAWVKDPVKVLRVALEQACSIASTFATSGIAIAAEQPKPLDQLLGRYLKAPQPSEEGV